MFSKFLRSLALCFVLVGLAHGATLAQSIGRVAVTVKDPKGNAMPGIEVAVENEKTGYKATKKTNKKGKITFTFNDTSAPFIFKLAVDGYVPIEKSIEISGGAMVREEFKLQVVRTISAEGGIKAGAGDDTGMVAAFNAGVVALQGGDFETAKAKFAEVLATDDKMALAHSALAGIYLRENDYQGALTAINRFLEISPPDSRAYRTVYEANKGLGNEKEAEKALEELSKLNEDGDTTAILYNEGLAAMRVGDTDSAQARFEEALELEPGMPAALTALAKIYSDNKDHAKAAEIAEILHAKNPDNINFVRLLYVSYHELGDTENRDRAFKLLAEADPEAMAKQFFDHGVALFNAGQVDEARGEFERALELDEANPLTHLRLGMCYVNLGQQDKAKTHLTRFVTDEPDHAEAELARNMLKLLK